MSVWDVHDGDQIMLFHVKTGLFAGKPISGWYLDKTQKMIPAVSETVNIQPFTIRKVSDAEQENDITTDSLFVLSSNIDKKDFLVHTPIYTSAELESSPPLRVTLVDTEPVTSLHTEWIFSPASENQLARRDTTLHYGMPVYFIKRRQLRYLCLDSTSKWLAVDHTPVQVDEMDSWMVIPTFSIHSCLSAKSAQCHTLSGTAVSRAMMTCSYQNGKGKGKGKRNTKDEIQCVDDGGHLVFRELQDLFETMSCS